MSVPAVITNPQNMDNAAKTVLIVIRVKMSMLKKMLSHIKNSKSVGHAIKKKWISCFHNAQPNPISKI